MDCVFDRLTEGGACLHCNQPPLKRDYDTAPRRACKSLSAQAANPVGLGDYTERLLMKAGITEDRYKAAKEMFGLAPTCGCAPRKDWLNKVSDWWRGQHA